MSHLHHRLHVGSLWCMAGERQLSQSMSVILPLVTRLCSALHVPQFTQFPQEHHEISNLKWRHAHGDMKSVSEQETGPSVLTLLSSPRLSLLLFLSCCGHYYGCQNRVPSVWLASNLICRQDWLWPIWALALWVPDYRHMLPLPPSTALPLVCLWPTVSECSSSSWLGICSQHLLCIKLCSDDGHSRAAGQESATELRA